MSTAFLYWANKEAEVYVCGEKNFEENGERNDQNKNTLSSACAELCSDERFCVKCFVRKNGLQAWVRS